MAKMSKKMIALCTTAISAIYTAGYIVTAPTETKATADRPAVSVSIQSPQSSNHSAAPSSVARQGKYRDGTYYGQGTNRFGTVEVAVTIAQGKISAVRITNCTTHYPQSYIDSLPDQVVARQSANVDIVTGATGSSEDFRMAVRDALAQAEINM